MEIVLLGHMGRDEATADRLEGHKLHVLGQWRNPGLVDKAETSGGQFHVIDSVTNVSLVADYVQAIEPDMFLTNFDDSLAAGTIDVIKQRIADKRMPDVLLPCPDRAAARIEWDKFYLRELINTINPAFNPVNFMAKTEAAAQSAIDLFESNRVPIVLKPRNLTGGKGVKVMEKHFETYDEGRAYASQVLADAKQTGIEIQEKLEGYEFTLQLFTDGEVLIKPPATYDYPYREDGDKGPGTGGMGAFSMPAGEQLPFVTTQDYNEAISLMVQLLAAVKDRSDNYKGVLYPTFFKTDSGLKIVEVNARGGDPELINILDLMEDNVDFAEVLKLVALGELATDSIRYKKLASAMVYLVSPDYGYANGPSYDYRLRPQAASDEECRLRFAASERIGSNHYRTVGSSRTVGISALGSTPWDARRKINSAIANAFTHPLALNYRRDVASQDYIKSLAR